MANLRRTRTPAQKKVKSYQFYVCQVWRTLSAEVRQAWQDWVDYLPQPTLRNPAVFLSAYENFIKRNYFQLLHYGPGAPLMLSPSLITVADDTPTFSATLNDDIFELSYSFTRGENDMIFFINLYCDPFASRKNRFQRSRLLLSIPNVNGSSDITSAFLSAFGVLPSIDSVININYKAVGKMNGQLFFRQAAQIVFDTYIPTKFGIIYNVFALTDSRNICPAGCRLFDRDLDYFPLLSFLGGESVAGGLLKSTNSQFWSSPNTGATDMYNFSIRGSGFRTSSGLFQSFKALSYIFLGVKGGDPRYSIASYTANSLPYSSNVSYKIGLSCRWVVEEPDGSGFVTGNDGRKYATVVINGKTFTRDTIAETKFRNGDIIPLMSTNSTWGSATSAGCCYPNDDINNV
jgi:uncharacterized protein (TIGR02145 family)